MKKEIISGGICGGVINQTLFQSNPEAYMMAFVMPDKQFEKYKKEKDEKKKSALFDKYARSVI